MDKNKINITDVVIESTTIELNMYIYKTLVIKNPLYIIQINDVEINNLCKSVFEIVESDYTDFVKYKVSIDISNIQNMINHTTDDNTLDITIANKITLSTTLPDNNEITTSEYIISECKNHSIYSSYDLYVYPTNIDEHISGYYKKVVNDNNTVQYEKTDPITQNKHIIFYYSDNNLFNNQGRWFIKQTIMKGNDAGHKYIYYQSNDWCNNKIIPLQSWLKYYNRVYPPTNFTLIDIQISPCITISNTQLIIINFDNQQEAIKYNDFI